MREKIVNVLNKIYGIVIGISLFAGLIPLIPFIIAIIIGGDSAALICDFIYKEYYPYVIVMASVAVVIGLITMYIAKHDFSLSKKKPPIKTNSEKTEDEKQKN